SVRSDHGRIKTTGGLDRALLGGIVDVNEPEPLGESERPLVVVEQRPRVVAAEIDALGESVVGSAQMLPVVFDAQRIVDAPVDGVRWIVERGAVLGDVD